MGLIAKCCALPGVFRGLHESELASDPFAQFDRWMTFAKRAQVFLPNATMLATVGADGRPSARMMLLKGADPRGFVFYTNYESRKGRELEARPDAALVLHWTELQRQVRVEGRVARLTRDESAKYFHSRLRGSQIGAWASPQSRAIPDRETLERADHEMEERFKGGEVPLPEHWGGFRLVPDRVEFWQGRAFRLHDRLVYVKTDAGTWRIERLAP